jgi:alkanesulfonate monooxygenase SsuD/methylene tetrahydromethanopterin reductase-like flavin-dependent oxidoreductase (luciferase family)
MTGPIRSRPTGDDDAVRIGIVAPDCAHDVRELERLGVDSLWVGGHVASKNPSPEAMVWLARLVEQTTTAVVGTATLLLPLYPPAIAAKQLADLDRASCGRLIVGVGVGGEYESDFAAAEVQIDERGSRPDEAIGLLRRFWTAEPVNHDGRHHRFKDVRIHPALAQAGGPPIVVSGRQPVAMRRAARLGDGWMPYLYSPERYARSVETIEPKLHGWGETLVGSNGSATCLSASTTIPTRPGRGLSTSSTAPTAATSVTSSTASPASVTPNR